MEEKKVEQILKSIERKINSRDKLLINLTKEIALLRMEIKKTKGTNNL